MKNSYFAGLDFALSGVMPNASSSMKRHPVYYGIQYVHKGKLYLSLNDGELYHLEGPVAFLTSPETLFSYGSPPGTSREQYHLCVNGKRMKQYVASGLFPLAVRQKTPYYRILYPDQFLAEMLELMLLIRSGEKHDFAVCRYEHLLLSLQNQQMQSGKSGFYHQELEELTMKILKNPESDWNFREFAEKLNISGKHFLRLFRKAYGMPPHHFVLQQRIAKACTLLLLKSDPVKTVADECGFPNAYYFSRLFKKYMKITPELYRNTR